MFCFIFQMESVSLALSLGAVKTERRCLLNLNRYSITELCYQRFSPSVFFIKTFFFQISGHASQPVSMWVLIPCPNFVWNPRVGCCYWSTTGHSWAWQRVHIKSLCLWCGLEVKRFWDSPLKNKKNNRMLDWDPRRPGEEGYKEIIFLREVSFL